MSAGTPRRPGRVATGALVLLAVGAACNGDTPFWERPGWGAEITGARFAVHSDSESSAWGFVVYDSIGEVAGSHGPFPSAPPVLPEVFILDQDQGADSVQLADSIRYVLENTETVDDRTTCVIRIFDQSGRMLAEHRKAGECEGAVKVDTLAHEKLIWTEEGEGEGWILVDFFTGDKLGESTVTSPPNESVVDVERVGGHTVIVLEYGDASDIRVRVLGLDGLPLHVFDIPGEFVEGVDNDSSLKAITTERNDTLVHNDLINVITGQGVQGLPQNPIKGEHVDLQHHRVGTEDRFIEVVFDRAVGTTGETTIRTIDGNGRIVFTQVLPGRVVAARAMGAAGNRKVFAVNRAPYTDLVVLDLVTGRQLRVGQFAGDLRDGPRLGPGGSTAEIEVEGPGGVRTESVPLN